MSFFRHSGGLDFAQEVEANLGAGNVDEVAEVHRKRGQRLLLHLSQERVLDPLALVVPGDLVLAEVLEDPDLDEHQEVEGDGGDLDDAGELLGRQLEGLGRISSSADVVVEGLADCNR